MRRFPGCWTDILPSLGFRRILRKPARTAHRRSRIEQLEERQMLSGVPYDDQWVLQQLETAAAEAARARAEGRLPVAETAPPLVENPFATPFLATPSYAIVSTLDKPANPNFTVATTFTATGEAQALLTFVGNATTLAGTVQEINLELRSGNLVLERQQVLVDIATQAFLDQFLNDRIAQAAVGTLSISANEAKTTLQAADTTDIVTVSSNVAVASSSVAAGGNGNGNANGVGNNNKPVLEASALAKIAKRQNQSDDVVNGKSQKIGLYNAFKKTALAVDAALKSANASAKSRADLKELGKSAILLAKSITADLKSADEAIATAARGLRDQLLTTLGSEYTLFAGLGKNRELLRDAATTGRGQTVLVAVEEATATPLSSLKVALGSAVGLVQVTRTGSGGFSNFQTAPLYSTSLMAYADTSVSEANPSATTGGSATSLTVASGAGVDQRGLLKLDLAAGQGLVVPTALLDLNAISASGATSNRIEAYRDFFGYTTGAGWSEGTQTWTDQSNLTAGFSSTLATWTPTAGQTSSVNVSQAVQRALLVGDTNVGGGIDVRGVTGDVDSFYWAIRNWTAYTTQFSGQTALANELQYRNDINWDGVVNTTDVAPMFHRWGLSRGDFNVDGVVNIHDYNVWSTNYGATLTAFTGGFTRGDGNFDGLIDSSDYTFYSDNAGALAQAPRTPELTLRVTATDETAVGSVSYASRENTSLAGPTLRYDYELTEFLVNTTGDAAAHNSAVSADSNNSVAGDQVTLRSALQRINVLQATRPGRYTIKFAENVTTIDLTQNLTIASGNVTIEGPSAGLLTLNAASITTGLKRPLTVSAGATVTLKGLRITGGALASGNLGGGILNYGDLTLERVTVVGNTITDGGGNNNGGGIFSDGTSLRIINSQIAYNQSKWGAGLDVRLSSGDRLEVVNSVIDSNTGHGGGFGGGMVMIADPGAIASIRGSRITNNTANLKGAGVSIYQGTLTIEDSEIAGNTVGSTSASDARGGGISNQGSGELILRKVKVLNNQAKGNYVYGAGIYSEWKKTDIQDSTIDGNKNVHNNWGEGGGLFLSSPSGDNLLIARSTISNNYSAGIGGLYVAGGTGVTGKLLNTTISGNSSQYIGGMRIGYEGTSLAIINSTITENIGESTGGLELWGGSATVHNTIISGNRTTSSSNPLPRNVFVHTDSNRFSPTSSRNLIGTSNWLPTFNAGTNNIFSDAPQLLALADNGGLTKTHALSPTSPALNQGSNSIATSYGLTLDQRGRNRTVQLASTATPLIDIGAFESGLTVSTLTDELDTNYAVGDLSLREALSLAATLPGTNEIEFYAALNGGVIELGSAGELSVNSPVQILGPGLDKLTIDANYASRVLKVESGVAATIKGLTITGGGGTTVSEGAGILNLGQLIVDEAAIIGNDATRSTVEASTGGGIASRTVAGQSTAALTVINSTIDGNLANAGAGVHVNVAAAAKLEIRGSTISHNMAATVGSNAGKGGGLLVTGPGYATISNSTFSGNSSVSGGGIRVDSANANVNLVHVTVTDNHADATGGTAGGIANPNSAVVTMHNSIVAGNTAATAAFADHWGKLSGTAVIPSSHNLLGVQDAAQAVGSPQHSGLANAANGNKVGTLVAAINPLLTPLADHGGSTLTHIPLIGSPTIDAASDLIATKFVADQRGYDNLVPNQVAGGGGRAEIGAASFDYMVNTTADLPYNEVDQSPGQTSLREAIGAANKRALDNPTSYVHSRISFTDELAGMEVLLNQGTRLFINSNVEIVGLGANKLAINAQNTSAIFGMNIDREVTISGLTLKGGAARAGGQYYGVGGAVANSGHLTLDGVEIVGNNAWSGGAIHQSSNSRNSSLAINNSTIVSNTLPPPSVGGGPEAGGIFVAYGGLGPQRFNNVTIANNQGDGYRTSSGAEQGIVFTNVTVVGNGGWGIASAFLGLAPELQNSIVHGNVSGDITHVFDADSSYNLIGSASNVTSGITDGEDHNDIGVTAQQLKLTTLGYYGGTTRTMVVMPGSIAIDSGKPPVFGDIESNPYASHGVDQRGAGYARLIGAATDVGAVESPWRFSEVGGSLRGAGAVAINHKYANLTEGDSTKSELSQLVVINESTLRLKFKDLVFDHSAVAGGDSFEIAVVDSAGNTLLPTIGSVGDALFRISDNGVRELAPGVIYGTGVVSIDTSQIAAGTVATVITRLRNPDSDIGSMVKVELDTPRFDLWGVGNQPRPKVDVFFLFDDTSSFSTYTTEASNSFQAIASSLSSSLPTIDFGFGVGRFEDYADPSFPFDRPFILNQPIIASTTTNASNSIIAALSTARASSGDGGDPRESILESLYQTATGLGYDGTDSLNSSWPLGALNTQRNYDPQASSNPSNLSGDVPPFSVASFVSSPSSPNYILPPQGSIGGAGFRQGALPIVILATDIQSKYRDDVPAATNIVGAGGIPVPKSEFTNGGWNTATDLHSTIGIQPPAGDEAGIQQTIAALNSIGALVIGLGTSTPRTLLEAVSKATGAVSASVNDIPSGIAGDPIQLGDPLYFQIQSGGSGSVATGVTSAIQAALTAGSKLGTLFRYTGDYTATNAGYQNFGQIQYWDTTGGSSGTWKAVGSGISDLTIAPEGTAYLVANKSLNGVNGPVLLKMNLENLVKVSQAADAASNLARTTIVGSLQLPVGQFNATVDRVTGLAFEPVSNRLFGLLRDADSVDRLYAFNPQTGALIQDFGPLTGSVGGQSYTVQHGESLTVDYDGTLLVTDDDNDVVGLARRVYRVNPSTGVIVDVVDGNVAIEHELTGITVDPATGGIVASNTQGNASALVSVTPGSATNPQVRNMLSLDMVTDVESLAFVTPLRGSSGLRTLVEHARLVTTDTNPSGSLETTYTVGANSSALRIAFENLQFSDAGNANNRDFSDAFEIAILNATTGKSAVSAIDADSDAAFSITQGQAPVWGTGVQFLNTNGTLNTNPLAGVTSGCVQVNLSTLAAGTQLKIVARLINNDADDTSQVSINLMPPMQGMYSFVGGSSARTLPTQVNSTTTIAPAVNLTTLHDVSTAFDVTYKQTTFKSPVASGPGELTTRIALNKLPSSLQVRGDLLLAIKPPTDQVSGNPLGTQLLNYDGRLDRSIAGLPVGTPFIRLSNLLPSLNGFYQVGSIDQIELVLQHQGNSRFDVDFVVLGELNEAPSIISDPYAENRGQAYPMSVVGTVGGPVVPMLEIVAKDGANGNVFRYTPQTRDPNNDRVRIEVISGPSFAAGDLYDSNNDGFKDSIKWEPTTANIGQTHTFVLRAYDEHDAFNPANDQKFSLRVVSSAVNRPPYFTTSPETTLTYGEPYSYDSDAFDPENAAIDPLNLPLKYTGSLGPQPQKYLVTGSQLLQMGVPSRLMSYLTFINEGSVPLAKSTFSGIRIYESGKRDQAQTISFNRAFKTYNGSTGTGVTTAGGDGSVLHITGNTRKAYQLDTPYLVTPSTILEFTFASGTQGSFHGLGLDDDLSFSAATDKWFKVYGNGTDPAVTVLASYDPAWDTTPNFAVNQDSGLVTWTNPPAELIGEWVHVALKAEETAASPLSAVQEYDLLIAPGAKPPQQVGQVDLTISDVDASKVTYDPQRLQASGRITAKVKNTGPGTVNGPFQVTFFEDVDFDKAYDPTRDHTLGVTTVEQSLADDATIDVAATISGGVQFAGAVIWGFVDSGETLSELIETNNFAASNSDCKVAYLPGSLDPIIERTLVDGAHVFTSGAVIDLNNDGVPEIIVAASPTDAPTHSRLRAIDGASGQLLWETVKEVDVTSEIAVGDLDGDGSIEIVALFNDESSIQFRPLVISVTSNGVVSEYDPLDGWQSTTPDEEVPVVSSHLSFDDVAFALANVDNLPGGEIILGTDVFYYDKSRLLQNRSPVYKKTQSLAGVVAGNPNTSLPTTSVVADINNDGTQDIVFGASAITHTGALIWHSPTLSHGFNGVANLYDDPSTSSDNSLAEVVLVSNGVISLLNGQTGVPIWQTPIPSRSEIIQKPQEQPIVYPNAEDRGGPPLIANLDGDPAGTLEIGVAGFGQYVVLDSSGLVKWTFPIQDFTSGMTSSSVFDFDGDGTPEIVHGDEVAFRLLSVPASDSGSLLVERYKLQRPSGTVIETPIVADLDGDGKAEVLISANQTNRIVTAYEERYGQTPTFDKEHGLYVLGDRRDSWVSTRPIWNQHSYHISNIQSDGSIPSSEQSSWITHNSYRQNVVPALDTAPKPAPDLIPSYVRVQESSGTTTYTARIGNGGSSLATKGIVVNFYNDNPSAGGTLVGSVKTQAVLDPGRFEDVSITVPSSPVPEGKLWVVVDPVTTLQPVYGAVRECDEHGELNNKYNPQLGFVVTPPNHEPVIGSNPVLEVVEGEQYVYDVNATDSDPGQTAQLVYDLPVKPDQMSIHPTTGVITWKPTPTQIAARQFPVTVRVQDGHGGKAYQTFNVKIISDNVPPIITPTAVAGFKFGQTPPSPPFTHQVVASDRNGDNLTYSLRLLTPLQTTDAKPSISLTGLITWAGLNRVADVAMEVTVLDGRGGIARRTIVVPVRDGNTPPQFVLDETLNPLKPVVLNESWSYTVKATDTEDGPSPGSLEFKIDEAAFNRGFRINPSSGVLTWTPTDVAPATVSVTVTDTGELTQTTTFDLPVNVRTVVPGPTSNEPPTFESSPQAPARVGKQWRYDVVVQDIDSNDRIEFVLANFNYSNGVAVPETEYSITETGRGRATITYTPSVSGGGVRFDVVASDFTDLVENYEIIQNVQLSVLDNSAPVIVRAPASATVVLNVEQTFEIEIVDIDPLETARLELVTPAPGTGRFAATAGGAAISSIIPSSNVQSPTKVYLHFTPELLGNQSLTVRVIDKGGKQDEHTILLKVLAPVANALPSGNLKYSETATVGVAYIAQATGEDPNAQTPIFKLVVQGPGGQPTYVDEITSGMTSLTGGALPVGMMINSATGKISWTPTAAQLTPSGGESYKFIVAVDDDTNPGTLTSPGFTQLGPASVRVVSTFQNTPPRITSTLGDKKATLSQPLVYQATAVDDENHPVTWRMISGPETASITEQGLFIWKPEAGEFAKSRSAIIQVFDPYGPGEQQIINLVGTSTNTPPRIESVPSAPGRVGEAYTYILRAKDDEGSRLTFLPVKSLNPGQSFTFNDLGDGTATFVWNNPSGTQEFTFQASDGQLLSSPQTIKLTPSTGSGTGVVDTPPRFLNSAPRVVTTGQTYTHTVRAVDDNGPVEYSLTAVRKSNGSVVPLLQAAINTTNGEISWSALNESPGEIEVTLIANQVGVSSVSARQTFTLTVLATGAPNGLPLLDAPIPLEAAPGDNFQHQVTGSDPQNEPLQFFLVNGAGDLVSSHNGFAITPAGVVTYNVPPTATPNTTYPFTVQVMDAAGQVASDPLTLAPTPVTYTLRVVTDLAPVASLSASTLSPEPNTLVRFALTALDDVAIVDRKLTVTRGSDVFTLPIEADGTAYFRVNDPVGTTYQAVAQVRDSKNVIVSTLPLTLVVTAPDATQPVVLLSSPLSGSTIKTSTMLRGRLYDPGVGGDQLTYISVVANPYDGGAPVTLLLKDKAIPSTFTAADLNANSFLKSIGNATTDGDILPLSAFDLSSGAYELIVTVRDSTGRSAQDSISIGIETDIQLGTFAISFTDLEVSLGGLPIQVIRRYDTAKANEAGDFGHGWSLDVITGKMEFLRNGDPPNRINPDPPITGGSRITLTLPGGEKHGFTIVPLSADKGGIADGILGVASLLALGFQGDPGQGSALDLSPTSSSPFFAIETFVFPNTLENRLPSSIYYAGFNSIQGEYNAKGEFVAIGSETAVTFKNLGANLRLRTRDGSTHEFDPLTGRLLSSTDLSGNKVVYNHLDGASSIIAKTPADQEISRLTIRRDDVRFPTYITSITDPQNNKVEYTYDAQGNLASFKDRVAVATSGSTATATYKYGQVATSTPPGISDPGVPVGPHILTTVTNALGVDALKIGFDSTGKLRKIQDASGPSGTGTFSFPTPTGDGRIIESVADANGATTEILRDARGNIERRVVEVKKDANPNLQQYIVTMYVYDALDRQTHVSAPFDANGNDKYSKGQTWVTVPGTVGFIANQWQSIATFDSEGRLTSTTNALGKTTTYSDFDEDGNPRLVTDAYGNKTQSQFTEGLLSSVFDAADGQTNYSYEGGQISSVTQIGPNNESLTTSFDYTNGRLTSTTGSDGQKRYFVYDLLGNQTLTYHHWTGAGGTKSIVSRTFYDANGRVEKSAQYTLTGELQFTKAEDITQAPDWITETNYNAAGQVYRTVDRFGAVSLQTFDVRGNVVETRTTTKEGSTDKWLVTRTLYDANGRAYFTTDPYTVDQAGYSDLTPPPSAYGSYTQFDAAGRVVASKRFAGVTVTLASAGGDVRNSSSTFNFGAAGITEDRTYYDSLGRVQFTVSATGLITKFDYDELGRQKEVTQYLVGTLDTSGATPTVIGPTPEGTLVTKTVYDSAGRVESTEDAKGVVTRFYYDGVGRVTDTVADLNGLKVRTTTAYDKLGRKDYELDALNRRTSYEYDEVGRLTAVILPETTKPGGGRTTPRYEYGYDAYGNQILIRDPMDNNFGVGSDNKETLFSYDHLNRQTSRTLPSGVSETMQYNDALLSTIPLANRATSVGLGQLEFTKDFEGRVTAYRYDNTAAGGGRLAGKYFYATLSAYNTDKSGDGILDSAAQSITYKYDGFGRVFEIRDSQFTVTGTSTIVPTVHSYDAEGRLKKIASPQGYLNYDYNNRGELTRTWSGHASDGADAISDTRYKYDRLGRVVEVIVTERNNVDVSGTATTWETLAIDGDLTRYKFDQNGNLDESVNVTNGVISDYVYDNLNRLDLLRHYRDTNGTAGYQIADVLVGEFDYTVQADGKRTRAVEKNDQGQMTTIDWVYDELGRLTEERSDFSVGTENDYHTKYAFDLASNRIQMQKDVGNASPASFAADEITTYKYDANDRLYLERFDQTAVGSAGSVEKSITYEYGAGAIAGSSAGNGTDQTKRTEWLNETVGTGGIKTQETTNSYNVAGRLQQAAVNEDGQGVIEKTYTYKYNADGVRVEETLQLGGGAPTRTIYHLDPQNLTGFAQILEEGDDANNDGRLQFGEIAKSYTLGLDVNAQAVAATATYLLYDGHGSTRALVNGSGGVLSGQRFAFDAYGNLLLAGVTGYASATSAQTSLLYSGERTDRTGLQYLRARYYDPRNGRFGRVDPLKGNANDPLSLHRYLYTHGNPVMGVDPSGWEFTLVGLGAANSIGSSLNSIQGETGSRVAEIAFLAGQGATAANALVSVLAFDVLGLGIPALGNAFGDLLDVFSTQRSSLAKVLPAAPNGGYLLPGIMHISDTQIGNLFKRGSASVGDSQLLKANYAAAAGLPLELIGGIDRQFHHLIPIEVVSRSRMLNSLGFQVDAALNALPLTTRNHAGSHPSYSKALRRIMDAIEVSGRPIERKRELVLATITNASRALLEGESLRRSIISSDEWIRRISPL